MIYTRIAQIIAFLLVVSGALRVATGFIVAYAYDGDPAAIARYLGSVQNIGEAIDQGMYAFAAGVALGVLTEISRSLRCIDENTAVYEEDAA